MTNSKPPCLGCKKRSATCHAGCIKYGEWSAERDVEREQRKKENEVDGFLKLQGERWRVRSNSRIKRQIRSVTGNEH